MDKRDSLTAKESSKLITSGELLTSNQLSQTHLQKRKRVLVENPESTPQMLPYAYPPDPETHPAPECTLSLFQWQIEQESRRYEDVPPELLNLQDGDGDTCLHIAVAQGRRALAYMLASKMANYGALEVKERNGQTPLQVAVAANQHLIVGDLLLHGADINTRDSWGRSPLHVCAEKGFYLCLQSIWKTFSGCLQMIDTEMLNFDVLSHNAVENEWRRLAHTRTLDKHQCQFQQRELLQRKHIYVQCVKALLYIGASCGTKDLKSGLTCWHMAAEEANCQLLRVFLEWPSALSSLNHKSFSDNTALHVASSLQNHPAQPEALKMLMRGGADPTARNLENELPWQLAPGGPIGETVHQILRGRHLDA
ncbi:NF-kappa-B inhibitor zeta isoform X3 [Hippocampus zosterae]|uniref:NF-kappa-B inhibitor zeta isoform X3 n=1 Tax=Hippocampus zosterae TaxID=109293 RepID=UPI00223E8A97|nr:NF-kappa-B inhibitor zeta isoform X3 [Hippocampus zosterae]